MGRSAACVLPALALALVLALASSAERAAYAAAPKTGASERSAEILGRDRGWPAGSIEEQLSRDPTLVPFGKGAIFVPAMTNPLDEPTVAVVSGNVVVAEGTTGARIPVAPGTYEVRIGSGTDQQRLRFQATVSESHLTVLPAAWAGLQVHVVDEQYSSLRGSYELIRVEDREYIGIGFGTDEQAGEPVTTWIVRPGLYKIVRVGENYRARRDFSTVRLTEGNLTHFILVLDKDNGDFKGGGEIPEEEVFRPRNGFFGSLVLGGDASMNERSNVPTLTPGFSFTVHAFADSRLSMQVFDSPLLFRLQIEEGLTKSPDVPVWTKSNELTKLDALYVYQLTNWLGPYARFGAQTNLFPNETFFTPREVVIEDESGAVVRRSAGLDRVGLAPSFGETLLKEGAGINVRLFKSIFAETTVRTGVGARHRITRDLFEAVPSQTSSVTATFRRIPSSNQIGVEATVLASARITRWVILTLELDSLAPFDDFANVILDLDGSLALKLTSYVSVNYRLRYLRDPSLAQRDVVQHDVLLRFSLEIL